MRRHRVVKSVSLPSFRKIWAVHSPHLSRGSRSMSQRTVNPRRPSHAPPGPRLTALEPIISDAPLTGFAEFGVSKPVVDALKMRGISGACAIQELVLRDAIVGRDVLARSRTGSGKTLAFAVPIVE